MPGGITVLFGIGVEPHDLVAMRQKAGGDTLTHQSQADNSEANGGARARDVLLSRSRFGGHSHSLH